MSIFFVDSRVRSIVSTFAVVCALLSYGFEPVKGAERPSKPNIIIMMADDMELYDRINDPLEHYNLIKNPEYAALIVELKAHIPTEQAEEVVQVSKVVINVQTELLDRKKKIAGATYYDAQKRVNAAVIACESGEEEAVARALATEIFTKAIADGVYDPENLEKPGGAFASGKTDVLVEKKKTNAKTKPEKASKAD